MLFFFNRNTAYEMRISDWSSDLCSSDLYLQRNHVDLDREAGGARGGDPRQPARDIAVAGDEIGRATCRERVWKYVSVAVRAVSLQKQNKDISHYITNKSATP